MTNENRELENTKRSELKDALISEGRKLARGALEVSRKPLHELGDNLLDYFLDWCIEKVIGVAN